jgi:hypothetical protein
MAKDVIMSSDDDAPLVKRNGTGHVASNGNSSGRSKTSDVSEDSPMSEDDDMPLVSRSRVLRCNCFA